MRSRIRELPSARGSATGDEHHNRERKPTVARDAPPKVALRLWGSLEHHFARIVPVVIPSSFLIRQPQSSKRRIRAQPRCRAQPVKALRPTSRSQTPQLIADNGTVRLGATRRLCTRHQNPPVASVYNALRLYPAGQNRRSFDFPRHSCPFARVCKGSGFAHSASALTPIVPYSVNVFDRTAPITQPLTQS